MKAAPRPIHNDPLSPAFDAQSIQPEWQAQFSETHTFGNNKVNNFIASLQWYSALHDGEPGRGISVETLPQTIAFPVTVHCSL